MLEVKDMSQGEMTELLVRGSLGHLGVARDGHPYVVPMNYVYDAGFLYFLTTEGTKTEFMAANHEVCFQVEEITDSTHWLSVMVFGRAERLVNPGETEQITQLFTERNPELTPALNRTKIGAWTRFSNVAIYRVRPHSIFGRKTA